MNRRDTLKLLGASSLVPSALAGTAAAEPMALDTDKPADILKIYRKLAQTEGTDPIIWWARLTRQGFVDDEFTPLWTAHIVSLTTTRDLDDGSGDYEATTISMSFYTDVETGAYLEEFDNPYTGETVKIGYRAAMPGTRKISATDRGHGPTRPGFTVSHQNPLGPAWIIDKDVWVRSDDYTKLEPDTPEAGRRFMVQDWSTYHGPLEAVADPEVPSAPAIWTFSDILSWPPWMNMGDRPGHYLSRGFGRKVFAMTDLPEKEQELVKMREPAVFNDPKGALAG